jgi:hypothetical protein
MGERWYSFTILDLGTRRRGVVRFTPLPLYLQENSPWRPLDRRLGKPQSWSGRCGVETNLISLPGNRTTAAEPRRCAD